ncbi:hypothetical protein [Yinghuangia seranimata]|uniref:hypothetical protein n=1 Tax=Yinghuangia seranimata TaxID=408067 RepID=UPI00248AD4DC|nr:hypothetical protein [Yinghuangia seranimata]MDI2124620.1 hypothetical protein [Yinghuangia seranimata]
MLDHTVLSEGDKPAGVRPWTTADAEVWAAVHVPWFLRAGWPVAAMVAAALTVLFTAEPEGCPSGGTCAPGAALPVTFGLVVVYVVSLVRLAVLAVLCVPAVAVAAAYADPVTDDAAWRWGLLAAGLAWGLAASVARLVAARRQAEVLAADGLDQAAVPSSALRDRRRLVRTAGASAVVVAVAVLCAAFGAGVKPDRSDAPVVAYESLLIPKEKRGTTY